MARAAMFKDEIQEAGFHFLGIYLEIKNACIVLLSEGEDQLGTLAVAIPPSSETAVPSLSSVLMGDRNQTTARALAERLAAKTSKISLVSIYLKSVSEAEVAPILLRLFDKITQARPVLGEENVQV
jgi:predicted ATPase